MHSFLGRTGYHRPWIHDYRLLDISLHQATLQDKPDPLMWTEEMQLSFTSLKQSLISAQALGIPDYHLPFQLYVSEKGGLPLVSWLSLMEEESAPWPTTLSSFPLWSEVCRLVWGQRLQQKFKKITLNCFGSKCSVTQHFTAQCCTGHKVFLAAHSKYDIVRFSPLNPSTLMPDYYE